MNSNSFYFIAIVSRAKEIDVVKRSDATFIITLDEPVDAKASTDQESGY